jgi:CheY-like chemotaxis protein
MPNMDGYTMMRQLRARETVDRRRTPAIALTAFSRAEDRIRALEAGYTFHLSKPVDLRELIAAIGSLAQAHHAP